MWRPAGAMTATGRCKTQSVHARWNHGQHLEWVKESFNGKSEKTTGEEKDESKRQESGEDTCEEIVREVFRGKSEEAIRERACAQSGSRPQTGGALREEAGEARRGRRNQKAGVLQTDSQAAGH
ncbi:protein of unknown function [Nitrospira japonica]|uniref:Uncharacterized protein n=1 Tax=Nitrospira japonica TaxID=1325564 RepID=A0A1W1I6K9_9BACT|nr:protein of unknown function [Nitrospira japonica]